MNNGNYDSASFGQSNDIADDMEGQNKNQGINIIQGAADVFNETLRRFKEDVPKLIKADKPMAAISLANQLDETMQSTHATLSGFYRTILDRSDLLERHGSPALERFKSRGYLKAMFGSAPIKTFGYYIYGEGLPDDVSAESIYIKLEKHLGKSVPSEIFVTDSRLKKIIFIEIFFYIQVLISFVESGWGIIESTDGQQFADRYIRKEVKMEVWRRDQGRCVECGSQEKLEYDHIIPVAKGGSNTPRNIQLLCEACNRSKSDSIG